MCNHERFLSKGEIPSYTSTLIRRVAGRKVFTTRLGVTGVGAADLDEGHLLILPFGVGGFYILRQSLVDEERCQMVGVACVSGLMDLIGIGMA